MEKTRIISSPRQDYLLTPSTPRRYSNQILGWFIFLFASSFYLLSFLFFFEGTHFFFQHFNAVRLNDLDKLSGININMFKIKTLLLFISSGAIAYFTTELFTKPVTRQIIKDGNFIDDSPNVFMNLEQELSKTPRRNPIPLMTKGDFDPNSKTVLKNDILLNDAILELSFLIRGEAGSGKTVLFDRLIKATIEKGHKVILHNIKGDELKKLSGYCPFYLIEPWNEKAGYAINFLQLLARERETDRNAYILSFVNSFVKKSKTDAFFTESAIEVLFALVKKVAEDNMRKEDGKLICKAGLQDIVNLWTSFQATEAPPAKSPDDVSSMVLAKYMKQNTGSLEKIKALLIEKNPTQADLIDPNNAKTSLCILATCTKTVKKFEVLAKFWGGKEKSKSLDLVSWLNNKKDRPVILLSNSNLYTAEAEAYISAVINLLTMFVINPEYEPSSEVHFMLDEFPQLSSIDLKQFLKLPDVGRGKKIRVKVALQRTSQIKEDFDYDSQSFASAFQNKVWARMATDDLESVRNELGKQKVAEYQATSNSNNQGISSSLRLVEKLEDVINPNELQNELGPLATEQGEFIGCRILLKFANVRRVVIATFPPVQFPKRLKARTVTRSTASAGGRTASPGTEATQEEPQKAIDQPLAVQEVITQHNPAPQHEEAIEDPLGDAIKDVALHVVSEPVAVAAQAVELAEALTTNTNNHNEIFIQEDKRSEAIRKIVALKKNKNKEIDL